MSKGQIAPIRVTGTIIDYQKACRNLGSETQKMQMLAQIMVAALRKGWYELGAMLSTRTTQMKISNPH